MNSDRPEINISLNLERSFGSLAECVVICDADRKIFFVNRATEETFGHSRDELIGQTSERLYANPRDYASTDQIRDLSSTDGSGYKYSLLFRRKNGKTFNAEVVSTPIYDDGGTHIGFLSIARDITDRIALETLLKDASLTLEDAIEAISEGFALYDKNDRLVICNNKYRQLYAHSAPVMKLGIQFADILQYGLDRDEYDTKGQSKADWLKERLKKHDESDGSSIEQSLSDGTWLQITEQKTRSGSRVGIRTDITALKNAQNDLKAANRDWSLLADNLSCAIVELSPNGECVFINRVGAAWFGGRPSDFVGTAIRNHLPLDVREQTHAALQRALDGEKTYVESGFVFPDDVFRHAAIEYTPKRNEAGSVESLIVFANDITDRKKTEQTLAELYNITSTRELDSDGKIDQILELGCDHFDLDFGIVSRVSDELYTITTASSPENEIEVGTCFPLGDTYCKHTLLANEPLAITHTARSSLASHPCYEIFKLESYIGAPLLVAAIVMAQSILPAESPANAPSLKPTANSFVNLRIG